MINWHGSCVVGPSHQEDAMRGMIWGATVVAVWVIAWSAGPAAAGTSVPVPEPTSLALLAAGLGGAAIIKLRRRK